MIGFNSFNSHLIVVTKKMVNINGPLLVRIQGRKAGLFSWLMVLCGIKSTVTLSIFRDRVEFSMDSLFGKKTDFIPMEKVSALGTSYSGSELLFAFFVVMLAWGGIVPFFSESFLPALIFLLSAVLLFVAFVFSKRYGIHVSASGTVCQLMIRKSVIEGETLTQSDLETIREIFRSLVSSAHGVCEPERNMLPPQIPTDPLSVESTAGWGMNETSQTGRGFSSILPAPPIPPGQAASNSSVQPSIQTPIQPPLQPPVQPPVPPQFRR